MHHKWESYDAWFLRYKVQRTKFFVTWSNFLSFDHTKNPKFQNFEKIKKTPRDIIILHLHTCVPQLTIFDIWFVSVTEIFVILGYLLPFYPPNNPENQKFEKMKKNYWRYYHFTHKYHKWKSHDVWFLRYGVQFFLILDHFLPFYPTLPLL